MLNSAIPNPLQAPINTTLQNPIFNPLGVNTSTPLIPNPVQNLNAPAYSIGLTQMEGFSPIKQFRDSTNTDWVLKKASDDPTMGVPDTRNIQWVDAWCAQHPDKRFSKVMVYIAEGVCMPRIETEKPMRIMFQWCSLTKVQGFNPSMVQDKDWLRANIYTAALPDARASQLYALCQCGGQAQAPQQVQQQEEPLIKMSDLADTQVQQQ